MIKKTKMKVSMGMGALAMASVIPFAVIACNNNQAINPETNAINNASSNLSVLKQDEVNQVNLEQEILNNLQGEKILSTSQTITEAKREIFTLAIAKQFHLNWNGPKTGFNYTYSHQTIASDGKISFEIFVTKNGTLPSIDIHQHQINVYGLTLVEYGKQLRTITQTTLSKDAFLNRDFLKLTSVEEIQTTLGLIIPSIPQNVRMEVVKQINQLTVSYVISYLNQNPNFAYETISVQINDFFDETIHLSTEQRVEIEQRNINKLIMERSYFTEVDNMVFNRETELTNEIKYQLGLNIEFKEGFQYFYILQGDPTRDSFFDVTIIVALDNVRSSITLPKVWKSWLTGQNRKTIITSLRNLRSIDVASEVFYELAINKIDYEEIYASFGLPNLSLSEHTKVYLQKSANSYQFSFKIKSFDASLNSLPFMDFDILVEVTEFGEGLTLYDLNYEQKRLNELGGLKLWKQFTTIQAVEHGEFNEEVAKLLGIDFEPHANFSYYYTHPRIEHDGNIEVKISVVYEQLSPSIPALGHQIRVRGFLIEDYANLLRDNDESTLTSEAFLNSETNAVGSLDSFFTSLGLAQVTLPLGLKVEALKSQAQDYVVYIVSYQDENIASNSAIFKVLWVAITKFYGTDANNLTTALERLNFEQKTINDTTLFRDVADFSEELIFNQRIELSRYISLLLGLDLAFKSDYKYYYEIIGDANHDGYFEVKFSVAIGEVFATILPQPKRLWIATIERFRQIQTIVNHQSSSLTEAMFNNLSFDWIDYNEAQRLIGLANLEMSQYSKVFAKKIANTTRLDFKIVSYHQLNMLNPIRNLETFTTIKHFKSQAQYDLNTEQKLINKLRGPKILVTYEPIEAITNGVFDTIVASQFGITNFVAKPGFNYRYSHSKISRDGLTNLEISVTHDQLEAEENVKVHQVNVRGFAIENYTRQLLLKVSSTLEETVFFGTDFSDGISVSDLALELGINLTTPNNSLRLVIKKFPNTKEIYYELSDKDYPSVQTRIFAVYIQNFAPKSN